MQVISEHAFIKSIRDKKRRILKN